MFQKTLSTFSGGVGNRRLNTDSQYTRKDHGSDMEHNFISSSHKNNIKEQPRNQLF